MPGYEVNQEWGTVIYPIEPPPLEPQILQRITADGYQLKNEFHITVVSSEIGKNLDEQAFGRLADYFSRLQEPDYSYDDRLFAISKAKNMAGQIEPRESLVAPVQATRLLGVVATAAMVIGRDMPLPFPHVTVATRPDTAIARRGIGISSRAEWEQLRPQLYVRHWQQNR